MKPFLQMSDVEKVYDTPLGPQVIVKDIHLDIGEGEFVSIIGHSGCGKTTVMTMVAGLTSPTRGRITLEGEPVTGPGPERAMVFQSHALLPWMTAEENVLLGVDEAYSQATPAERRAIADYYLDRVGLFKSKHKRPGSLSAGMRQRVGVARAFALQPKLLLLDEPFGSLDSVTRFELQAVLLELWSKTKTAALLVTHDVDEALYLSDRIVMMTDGPAAVIGEVLTVPFPRPRSRHALLDDPEYYVLRERMMDFLEHTSAHGAPRAEPKKSLAPP